MSKIRLQWASAGREYKKFVLTTLLFNTLFDFLYKFGSTSSSCQIGGCSYVYVRALGVCHASPCCFSTSCLFLPRSQDPVSCQNGVRKSQSYCPQTRDRKLGREEDARGGEIEGFSVLREFDTSRG